MHLWNLSEKPCGVFYPWLSGPKQAKSHIGGDLNQIRKNYLIDDYLSDIQGSNVVKSVHVQAECGDDEAETTWLTQVSKSHGFPHGIVARADFYDPNIEKKLLFQSQNPKVKGVRYLLNWDADPSLCMAEKGGEMNDPKWRETFKLLQKFNFSFDLHIWPLQVNDAIDLISAFPDTQFVLDHTGLHKGYLDPSPEAFEQWKTSLQKLSKFPNVVMKISGLSMTHHSPNVETFKPFILESIKIFGVDRLMFASNFPVDKMQGSYKNLVNVTKECLKDLSKDDQKKIFHDNAVKYYKLS